MPQAKRKPAERTVEQYAADHLGNPNAAIRAAYGSGQHSMAAIAQQFGLHYTAVSRIVKAQ